MLSRPRIPNVLLLVLGLLLGWGLAIIQPAPLRAGGGDRSGESIVATGPILIRYDEGNKVQIPLEALYFLDYKGGGCWGRSPRSIRPSGSSHYLGAFAERDLVADFKLDLDNGPRPHFLMTTGSLGATAAGWAPLYVIETTTNQVARLPDPAADGRDDGRRTRSSCSSCGRWPSTPAQPPRCGAVRVMLDRSRPVRRGRLRLTAGGPPPASAPRPAPPVRPPPRPPARCPARPRRRLPRRGSAPSP